MIENLNMVPYYNGVFLKLRCNAELKLILDLYINRFNETNLGKIINKLRISISINEDILLANLIYNQDKQFFDSHYIWK